MALWYLSQFFAILAWVLYLLIKPHSKLFILHRWLRWCVYQVVIVSQFQKHKHSFYTEDIFLYFILVDVCMYVRMAMKTDVSRHIPHKAKTLNILMRRRRYFSLLAWEDISTLKRDKNCTVKTTAEYFSFPSFSRIWFAIYREESMLE